jgi:hypothetical protein
VLEAMMDPEVELRRDGKEWKTKDTLLALTAREAVEIGLAVAIAESVEEVILLRRGTKPVEADISR